MSDCCHYDEGYDDGYEAAANGRSHDGAETQSVNQRAVVDVLTMYARELFVDGSERDAAVLERIAAAVSAHPNFEARMKAERERRASIVAAYAEARKAAA